MVELMDTQPDLNELPFLRSLCWQSHSPSVAGLSELEILQLYERNWRYHRVLAQISETERQFIHRLAVAHHSWLVNHV